MRRVLPFYDISRPGMHLRGTRKKPRKTLGAIEAKYAVSGAGLRR